MPELDWKPVKLQYHLNPKRHVQKTLDVLGCVHTIKLCSINFAFYRAKIGKGFYAGVQTVTVRIIEVEYGNCGFAVS